MGAVLMQEGRPIAYASKSLTKAQQGYAQIEKEAMAIQFGCTKFHQYLYGRTFQVESDHRPLESIFKKPVNQVPARLQLIRMRLAKYDLEVTYKPGKSLVLADHLSRSPSKQLYQEPMEVHMILSVKNDKLQDVAQETSNDAEMSVLKDYIIKGWPDQMSEVPSIVQPYFSYRDELSVYSGVVFKGDKIVVPVKLRNSFLDELHYAHLGITLTQNRAREYLFWPRMNSDIEQVVRECPTCQSMQHNNPKEPLMPTPVPDRPWSVIAADLGEINGQTFLVIVDHYSGFIEVEWMRNSHTARTLIDRFKSQMARHGIADILVTDNGPEFACQEFAQFASAWGFEHRTSSPYKSNSNGFAEKAIQTVKRLVEKAQEDGKDPYLALLAYRSTPRSANIPSPAERLFSRRIKTKLPVKTSLLRQTHHSSIASSIAQARDKQKTYYDRNAKPRAMLSEGQVVRYQPRPSSRWLRGTIQQEYAPRSYVIKGDNGGEYRRNSQHINPIPSHPVVPEPSTHQSQVQRQSEPPAPQPQVNPTQHSDIANQATRAQHSDIAKDTPSPTRMNTRSQSGRNIKMPDRYKDYVT